MYPKKQYSSSNYGLSGYASAPYSQQYQNQQRQTKSSGASQGQYVNKDAVRVPYVNGWKKTRQGLLTIIASPYKHTNQHKADKSGIVYENWIAEIKCGMQKPYILPVLYRVDNSKIIIDQLSMVINPKAPNGGYCGTYLKSKRR